MEHFSYILKHGSPTNVYRILKQFSYACITNTEAVPLNMYAEYWSSDPTHVHTEYGSSAPTYTCIQYRILKQFPYIWYRILEQFTLHMFVDRILKQCSYTCIQNTEAVLLHMYKHRIQQQCFYTCIQQQFPSEGCIREDFCSDLFPLFWGEDLSSFLACKYSKMFRLDCLALSCLSYCLAI